MAIPVLNSRRKWGEFDELIEKKAKIEKDIRALNTEICKTFNASNTKTCVLRRTTELFDVINEETDSRVTELSNLLLEKLGWTGLPLRHECPICHHRLGTLEARRPYALDCGHVFCSECTDKLLTGDEYKCGVCREKSNVATRLFL